MRDTAMPDVPRVLHDMQPVVDDHAAAPSGVVWRLAEAARQLDANVLNLPPGQSIGTHAESDLDVLLAILAGTGTMTTDVDPWRWFRARWCGYRTAPPAASPPAPTASPTSPCTDAAPECRSTPNQRPP
jgi:hypothetical protein